MNGKAQDKVLKKQTEKHDSVILTQKSKRQSNLIQPSFDYHSFNIID
jgi:hypothetical protein